MKPQEFGSARAEPIPSLNSREEPVAPIQVEADARRVQELLLEREQLYARLHSQQAEMAHMSRLLCLGEMATELAHEINQPLATILNYGNGILRQMDQQPELRLDSAREAIQRITRQAHRGAEIIRRIRQFAQRSELPHGLFALNDCCQEAVHFLQEEMPDSEFRIQLDLSPTNPLVLADRLQVEQVLLNLIRNAVEAYHETAQSPADIRLQTRLDATRQEVEVRVEDRAGGIEAGLLARLFQPFTSCKSQGLGMGLFISRTLIESQGGRLWVETDGQNYSHFIFRLPLQSDPR
ncbi:sensor histidine kinase [Nitrincola tapanii]|nr:ATP-binding protein [Nitrincola tapanii]